MIYKKRLKEFFLSVYIAQSHGSYALMEEPSAKFLKTVWTEVVYLDAKIKKVRTKKIICTSRHFL